MQVPVSRMLLSLGAAGVLVLASVFLYMVGHRQGRGAACFEVAVGVRDSRGQSLRTVLLSLPGAVWDYTFWGSDCTMTIHAPTNAGWTGGRWRFNLSSATLYSEDDDAQRVYPG